MVALGLVLLVLSGLLTAGVVLSNTDPAHAAAFGVSLSNVSIGGLFLVGVIAGIVFGLGLAIMLVGAGRRRAKRLGLQRQVKHVSGERESLAEENTRLQEELERERAIRAGTAGEVYPDETAGPADAAAGGRHAQQPAAANSDRRGLFHR